MTNQKPYPTRVFYSSVFSCERVAPRTSNFQVHLFKKGVVGGRGDVGKPRFELVHAEEYDRVVVRLAPVVVHAKHLALEQAEPREGQDRRLRLYEADAAVLSLQIATCASV